MDFESDLEANELSSVRQRLDDCRVISVRLNLDASYGSCTKRRNLGNEGVHMTRNSRLLVDPHLTLIFSSSRLSTHQATIC